MVTSRLREYVMLAAVPLMLAAVFVWQNVLFVGWVYPQPNPDFSYLLFESFTLGVLLYGPAVLMRPRARVIYLLAMSFFVSLVFAVQYLYFSYYGGFAQASALKYAGQMSSEGGTFVQLLSARLFAFVLNSIALGVVMMIPALSRARLRTWKEKGVAAFVVLAIALSGYGVLMAEGGIWRYQLAHPFLTIHDIGSYSYSPILEVRKVGIFNYFLGDTIGNTLRTTYVHADDVHFVEDLFAQKKAASYGAFFGVDRGKNLIIIQFESLESVVIGQKVNGVEITPHLNKLTKEGLYFNNYYTQVGPGNTADAEFVTLNSLYPLTNTVAFIDFAHNTYTALPSLLQKNGYHTYVMHGDAPAFWNRVNIYPALGYEQAVSKSDYVVHEEGFDMLSDNDFFAQSAEKMQSLEQPFAATLITLSSHTPYEIPAKYQDSALTFADDSSLTDVQKKYLQSIHYADAALGSFIAQLKKEGLYDTSVIVIYGDHGTETDISDAMGGENSPAFGSVRASRVPLIILSPEAQGELVGTRTTPGSHLDLYPTLAHLLGFEAPQSALGQDLLATKTPVVTRRDPYSEIITAIRTKSLAYESAESGIFEEGSCLTVPQRTPVPIATCRALYDAQDANIKASDVLVRGNLIKKVGDDK